MLENQEVQFLMEVENTFQKNLSAIVGTKEFVSKTLPHILHKNGKICTIWGTSVAMTRCSLDNACLDKKYWTYALNMAF